MLTSHHTLRREASSAATYVCLSCRLKSQSSRSTTSNPPSRPRESTDGRDGETQVRRRVRVRTGDYESRSIAETKFGHSKRLLGAMTWRSSLTRYPALRAYHTSTPAKQHAEAVAPQDSPGPPSPDFSTSHEHTFLKTGGIRDQLRQWQELHGKDLDARFKVLEVPTDADGVDTTNNLTRLPEPGIALREQAEKEEAELQAMAHFSRSPEQDEGVGGDNRFLHMGDLIELEFPNSERESIIAVFIRRVYTGSQVFTMHGRWLHIPERSVQYSIPGWVSPKLVEPLVKHLPNPQNLTEYEEMTAKAYMEDLSVPREVAAPLVTRMVQFNAESQEIYRKHAGALDNAHDILAHETDLRYGSLVSAATTLLKTPPAKLPVTALFTVRKALSNAGFAFNIDRRSHRLTGYLQIRSKKQTETVDTVRRWLHDWQDDMAVRYSLEEDEKALQRHKSKPGAKIVNSFLDKARRIVQRSRESREPTICGNVGPSKKRFPITHDSNAIRVETEELFDDDEQELVRFIEGWACSNMYVGLPRIESLPPLLLQAMGLYQNYDLRQSTGFLFLQELGTVLPWENRVRFDQHLLLPSSQHSKPLQGLMTSLMEMSNKHNFQDSMADLRRDFGDLPVFCIDDASAQEIDDGLSVEQAGEGQWWVHIHIANPTAFFARDHPLAKMARHMGETIYMAERSYMMLPRWATKRHFSLGKDRPTLTFSVKMDADGKTLEHKVQPGFIRNVLRLTYDEVETVLGVEKDKTEQWTRTVVGGTPPPPRQRRSAVPDLTPAMKEQLQALNHLSSKRSEIRKNAGGVFFDIPGPKVEVCSSMKGPGLGWDHPYRKGSRVSEGDPVISLTTKRFQNWFSPSNTVADGLVREMMLLASETAAKWCAERKIPAVFRGVVPLPDEPDPEEFLREKLLPAAARDSNGEYPMHLAVPYIRMLGMTTLSSRPMRHRTLGLDHYCKITSPLRRYGDMIVHWQIEAALREEARTGQSLVTDNESVDRSFLPFSKQVLDTIMLGLQPREKIIVRAKMYAEHFWTAQAIFRAFHYGEATLPWIPTSESPMRYEDASQVPSHLPDAAAAEVSYPVSSSTALDPNSIMPNQVSRKARPPPPPQNYICHTFIHSTVNASGTFIGCENIEMNIGLGMERPERLGLGEAKTGDIWECGVLYVDCFLRQVIVRPRRLVHRPEE